MSDPFEDDLHGLGPIIDTDAAFGSFDSTRRRRRRRRRATGGGLGAIAAAGVGIIALSMGGGDPIDDVTAGPDVRFGPSLTGTVGDLDDDQIDFVSCAEAVADGINTIVYLAPDVSASDPSSGEIAAVGELIRTVDPDAIFVSQLAMHAETVALTPPNVQVAPPALFPASFRLTVPQQDLERLTAALDGVAGVEGFQSSSPPSIRSLCSSLPVGDTPLTSTVGDLDDDPLAQSACAPPGNRRPACVKPTDIEPAIGRVTESFPTGIGDEVGYVIIFEPDAPWTWRDLAGRERSSADLLQAQDPVTIEAWLGVDLDSSCDGKPEIGARVEAVPAGPLVRSADGSLAGSAWLLLTCLDADPDDFNEAFERWISSGVNVYSHNLRVWIEGQRQTVVVEGVDGIVTQKRLDPSQGRFDVDALFAAVREALNSEDRTVEVLFDPDLGYPVEATITGPGDES